MRVGTWLLLLLLLLLLWYRRCEVGGCRCKAHTPSAIKDHAAGMQKAHRGVTVRMELLQQQQRLHILTRRQCNL